MVYLIFNEGYGDGRVDLAAEAIRLTRTLAELLPAAERVLALLALMLLHDSRRDARFATTLPRRPRLLDRALAAAAAPCAVQPRSRAADRGPGRLRGVVALYDTLARDRFAAVTLNRAMAVAEADNRARR